MSYASSLHNLSRIPSGCPCAAGPDPCLAARQCVIWTGFFLKHSPRRFAAHCRRTDLSNEGSGVQRQCQTMENGLPERPGARFSETGSSACPNCGRRPDHLRGQPARAPGRGAHIEGTDQATKRKPRSHLEVRPGLGQPSSGSAEAIYFASHCSCRLSSASTAPFLRFSLRRFSDQDLRISAFEGFLLLFLLMCHSFGWRIQSPTI